MCSLYELVRNSPTVEGTSTKFRQLLRGSMLCTLPEGDEEISPAHVYCLSVTIASSLVRRYCAIDGPFVGAASWLEIKERIDCTLPSLIALNALHMLEANRCTLSVP